MDALTLFLLGLLCVSGGGTYLICWKLSVDDALPEDDDE